MTTQRTVLGSLVLLLCMALAACSGSEDVAADQVQGPDCESLSADVAEELVDFLEPFADASLENFGGSELAGLDDFQSSVLNQIVEANNSGSCRSGELEVALDAALADLPELGVVGDVVVDSIRNSGRRTVRDVVVSPSEDLEAILNSLAGGSSLRLSAGIYSVDSVLLVPVDLTIVGDDRETTEIRSTAAEAAIAVVGTGELDLGGLRLVHVGDAPASVVLAFGGQVELRDVLVSGGVTDADGAGGAGVVIGAAVLDGVEVSGAQAAVRITSSEISGNDQAGVILTADRSLVVTTSTVSSNGVCGVCALDSSQLTMNTSVVAANRTGVQLAGSATGVVQDNELVENTAVGLVIEGEATATIVNNHFRENGTAGIQLRGSEVSELTNNEFLAHDVGVSIEGTSATVIGDNQFVGGVIGLQVAGDAVPVVSANSFLDTSRVGLLISERAAGLFVDNTLASAEGTGVVVGGFADPMIKNLVVVDAEVGVAFGDQATGSLSTSVLSSVDVGIQIGGSAAPVITATSISQAEVAGVVYGEESAGEFRSNTVTGAGTFAIQVSAMASPTIEGNTIDQTATGISVLVESRPLIVSNLISGTDTGIDVSDSAEPVLSENQVVGAQSVALSIRGDSTPTVTGNTIIDAMNLGVQVLDAAAPIMRDNIIGSQVQVEAAEDPDSEAPLSTVGILYAGSAGGRVEGSEIFSFDVGIQVGDQATPSLSSNLVDGGGFDGIGLLFRDLSGGSAMSNRIVDVAIGFQLVDETNAEITNNQVDRIRDAAFIVSGSARPSLDQNQCPAGFPGIVIFAGSDPTVLTNDCGVSQQ